MDQENKVCSYCGEAIEKEQGYCNQCGTYVGEKPELLEVIEELQQTTDSMVSGIKLNQKLWLREGIIFGLIAAALSLGVAFVLGHFIGQSEMIQKIMGWFKATEVNKKIFETTANPLLLGFSMLYGGENQLYFIFNKMDEYRFTMMLPYFFIGITIIILWISEQIRYGLTNRQRDIYSNLAIAVIYGLVTIGIASLLSSQMVLRGEAVNGMLQGTKLQKIYEQYIYSVQKPSLTLYSTVDLLRLFGTSFLITFLTLTIVAKKHLFLGKYEDTVQSIRYICKIVLAMAIIIAIVIMGKLFLNEIYLPLITPSVLQYTKGFMFLVGVILCAILSGQIPFITYVVDANMALDIKMQVFELEANFKKSFESVENPFGGYYLVFILLVVLILLLGAMKLWKGRRVDIKQGVKETLVMAISLGLIAALGSKMGATSFYLECEMTNRRLNFNHLLATLGGADFWQIFMRVSILTTLCMLLGWGINQFMPNITRELALWCKLRRVAVILMIFVTLISLISVQTADQEATRGIYQMYTSAIEKSQANILLRLDDLFK